jgi:hypothetical protein
VGTWAHGDGQGFNLKLDNGADIVIRTPQSEQDVARGTAEAAARCPDSMMGFQTAKSTIIPAVFDLAPNRQITAK